MELVVTRQLLDQLAAPLILEDDEVAQQIQEAALLEDPFQQHLQLGHAGGSVAHAGDGAPGLEPFLPGAQCADARLHAVRDDQHRVAGEEGGDLRLISLELVEGGPDGGVLIGGVLQLDHGEWQAVDEDHHVRPPLVLALRHGELVDRQPVVVGRVVEVDDLGLCPGDGAVRAAVLDRDAVDQHAMHGAVALDERWRIQPRQLAVGVLQSI